MQHGAAHVKWSLQNWQVLNRSVLRIIKMAFYKTMNDKTLWKQMPEVEFCKINMGEVDLDEFDQKIEVLPTFLLYKNSTLQKTIKGANLGNLMSAIEQLK